MPNDDELFLKPNSNGAFNNIEPTPPPLRITK